ncbi:gp53-like domain-containing protein [Acinetobacter sp. TSRC1-2]|uniref:gp53-like domain-containing protein n=1 Tax=unclassified Acinetobacter TaxID=196816 RepID=UPI003CEB06FA
MPIEKLPEFAKDGQKNTDDLTLLDGFPVGKKPARQWFNWLFNVLMLKINEVVDNKLDKDANAVSATKLATARTVSFSGAGTGSFNYDGSSNSSAILTLANSGVVANTYGTNLKIPVITVNQKGLLTGVSEQNIPVGLEKNQLMKAGSSRAGTSATLEQFLNTYYGLSVPFFENGAAQLFGAYGAGMVSSLEGGGTFAIGASVIDGRVYGISVPSNSLEDAKKFEFYTSESKQLASNAATATKLANARMIGLTGAVTGSANFDGSGNIAIAAVLQNFESLKSTNGYKYLGDGLIFQWGTSARISDEQTVPTTFPVTFPNTCLNVQLTENELSTSSSNAAHVAATGVTKAGFNLRYNSSAATSTIAFWFAIGY